MRTRILLIVLISWLAVALPSRASIVYQYVTAADAYTIAGNAGDTVNIPIYLQEVLTSGSQSLMNANQGLFSAGVYVTQAGTLPSKSTTVSGVSGNQNDPASTTSPPGFGQAGAGFFTPMTGTNPATNYNYGDFTEALGVPAPPNGPKASDVATSLPANVAGQRQTVTNSVLLGNVTLTLGAIGTTTTFNIGSYDKSLEGGGFFGNTVTKNTTYDLDVDNSGTPNGPPNYKGAADVITPFTVTVIAMPEPSSLGLGAMAASGIALGAWRRWRNRAKQV